MQHELAGLFINVIGIDEYLANFGVKIITNCTNDQTRFLINQVRARLQLAGIINGCPELHQVIQIPLKFFGRAANSGSASNETRTGRNLELVHGLAQFLALFAFNSARNASPSGVIGHQHEVAACKRDKGGERRTFIATLLLFNLDQELSALCNCLFDAGSAGIHTGSEILTRDFFEWQKAVAFFTVIYKTGFEARLNPGHDTLVDIAFFLLSAGGLNIEIDQPLAVDDGNPQFLCMGGVK